MNKIITINLGGIAIQIEEDAYDLLRGYLKRLEAHFEGTENAEEILSDIEHRIAEMLYDRLKTGKVSINRADVDEVSAAMGSPDEMDAEDQTDERTETRKTTTNSTKKRIKRLFRDPDDGKIGGVCSGLAKYLDIDVAIIRIIWLIMLFIFGTGFLIYFLLWAILPEAKTAAEKLEMNGEVPNVENITNAIRDEANHAYQRIKDSAESGRVQGFFDKILGLLVAVIKIFARVFAIVLIVALIVAILGFFFRFFTHGNLFNWNVDFNYGLNDVNAGLLGSGPYWIMKISWFLFIVIPLLYVVVRLITMMLGVPRPAKIVRQGVLSVWLLTLLSAVGGMAWGASELKEEVKTVNRQELVLTGDTLLIRVDDLFEGEYKETDRRIELDVVQSSDQTARLAISKRARGRNDKDAEKGLSALVDAFRFANNEFRMNEYILVDDQVRAKLPEVRYTLEVPRGVYVVFNQNTGTVIHDIKNKQNIYDPHMAGKTFVMLSSGLSCTDCETDGNESSMNTLSGQISSIKISDALRVEIIEGTENEVIYPNDNRWRDAVDVEFDDHVLRLEQKDDVESILDWIRDNHDQKIIIKTTGIQKIELDGSSHVTLQADPSKEHDYFEMDLRGANTLYVNNLKSFKTSLDAAGTNKVNVNGNTRIFLLELDGASSVEAKDFVSESLNVDVDGAAICDVHSTKELTGKVDGASKLNYWGKPTVTVKSRGLSSVENRD
ncbi:MAG: DUF2807 domain-containing protein [Bacteroidetes bacterium]|nr:DUF2807 domain-containing protein [Bacteroidota bacterium]